MGARRYFSQILHKNFYKKIVLVIKKKLLKRIIFDIKIIKK